MSNQNTDELMRAVETAWGSFLTAVELASQNDITVRFTNTSYSSTDPKYIGLRLHRSQTISPQETRPDDD